MDDWMIFFFFGRGGGEKKTKTTPFWFQGQKLKDRHPSLVTMSSQLGDLFPEDSGIRLPDFIDQTGGFNQEIFFRCPK